MTAVDRRDLDDLFGSISHHLKIGLTQLDELQRTVATLNVPDRRDRAVCPVCLLHVEGIRALIPHLANVHGWPRTQVAEVVGDAAIERYVAEEERV